MPCHKPLWGHQEGSRKVSFRACFTIVAGMENNILWNVVILQVLYLSEA